MRFGSDIVSNNGSAIPTDAAPNTTAPDEKRVLATPDTSPGASLGVYGMVEGGTSIAVQLWIYDSGLKRWQKLGAAATIEADNAEDFGASVPLGARLFPQITTVTGGVTRAGFCVSTR